MFVVVVAVGSVELAGPTGKVNLFNTQLCNN